MRKKNRKTMVFHGIDDFEDEIISVLKTIFWPIALVVKLIDKFYATWIKSTQA